MASIRCTLLLNALLALARANIPCSQDVEVSATHAAVCDDESTTLFQTLALKNDEFVAHKPKEATTCEGACADILNYVQKERRESNWNVYYDEIADFLVARNSKVVAEIGTAWGGLAQRLLERVPNIEFHAVDPFLFNYDAGDIQSNIYKSMAERWQLSNEDFGHTMAQAHTFDLSAVAKAHGASYQMHNSLSVDAAPDFGESSIDSIFIDGLHTYEGVRDDITAYVPKMKTGGALLFNDYTIGGGIFPGVARAVEEHADTLPGKQSSIKFIGEPSHGNVFVEK